MITGSRDVDRQTARTLFEQHLSPFLSLGRTWIVGTSRGVDHWAMEWLLEKRNKLGWCSLLTTFGITDQGFLPTVHRLHRHSRAVKLRQTESLEVFVVTGPLIFQNADR